MATSRTTVANLALRNLSVTKLLTDVDSDTTEQALSIAAVYDFALQAVLADFQWPFATVLTALVEVEEDPVDEWDFSYRYPSDCLFLRRVISTIRKDRPGTPIPYKIIKASELTISAITQGATCTVTTSAVHNLTTGDVVFIDGGTMTQLNDSYTITVTTTTAFTLDGVNSTAYTAYTSGGTVQPGQLILCDLEDAEIEYTALVSNPWLYPPEFVTALALMIAYMAAPAITHGDQFGVGKRSFELYNLAISRARATAANEEKPDPPNESQFVTCR